MKYYETNFEDYKNAVTTCNIHPELNNTLSNIPTSIDNFQNTILYGPPGSGKYSVALSIIDKYSNGLKYDKKMYIFNDKTDKKKTTKEKKGINTCTRRVDFVYRMSDIHYEVDLSLLGCNAKMLWNEIFFQIVDIISVNNSKVGIILCKNVQSIYNEFLDIFHSYINEFSHRNNISIKFILITEHVSFLPDNVLHSFNIIPVKRPSNELYIKMIESQKKHLFNGFGGGYTELEKENIRNNIFRFGTDALSNLKETHILRVSNEKIPKIAFNVIVDDIIYIIMNPELLDIQSFRNTLYDILIYNLDIFECISHIVFYIVENNILKKKEINVLLVKLYTFFKYYNNNYRPIYHIESIIFDIIALIHYT